MKDQLNIPVPQSFNRPSTHLLPFYIALMSCRYWFLVLLCPRPLAGQEHVEYVWDDVGYFAAAGNDEQLRLILAWLATVLGHQCPAGNECQ